MEFLDSYLDTFPLCQSLSASNPQRNKKVWLLHSLNKLVCCDKLLFACGHVLESELVVGNLRLASKHNEGDVLRVGISHLLLHLRAVRIDFGTNAFLTTLSEHRQAIVSLSFAEVDEEYLSAACGPLGIEIKAAKHVVDAVCTERDTHSAKSRHSEDASKIVIASTTSNRTDGIVECLNLKDGSRVIVKATSEGKVQLESIADAALGSLSQG